MGAFTVGLTGGIGCGKSAAAGEFARLGADIIDTDQIARELVEPGQAALTEIIDRFGGDMLTPSGTLDRERLRERIFTNPTDRYTLEEILHPKIRAIAKARAQAGNGSYSIVVIPLLAENSQDYPLDRVLVIDCPESIQRQRVSARDGLPDKTIDAILAAQASRSRRLEIADDIIVNDQDFDHLKEQISRLHADYLSLSADAGRGK